MVYPISFQLFVIVVVNLFIYNIYTLRTNSVISTMQNIPLRGILCILFSLKKYVISCTIIFPIIIGVYFSNYKI